MSKSTFVDGMLLNAVLILAGVICLVWISTLGNNDIAEKMKFYGSNAGGFVAMFLFLAPFFFVFKKVSNGDLDGKRLAYWMCGMILVQLVIAAYIPLIVDLYRNIGVDLGAFIIRLKE